VPDPGMTGAQAWRLDGHDAGAAGSGLASKGVAASTIINPSGMGGEASPPYLGEDVS